MKKITTLYSSALLATLLFILFSCSQRKKQIKTPIESIISESIEIPYFEENDSLDFSFIDALIGDKEIVLLGEAGHGDGRTFEIKTQLINHLSVNKGFNFLALEGGGFLDMMIFNDLFPIDTTTYKEPKNLNYSWNQLWSTASETQQLQELIHKGSVIPIGIENQATRSSYYLPNFLKLFIEDHAITLFSDVDWNRIKTVNQAILSMDSTEKVEDEDLEYCVGRLEEIAQALHAFSLGDNPNHFKAEILKRSIENLLSFYEQFKLNWYTYEGQNKGINIRDRAMAENLIWHLKHQQSKAKIIVWTANFHVAKNIGKVRYNEDDPELYTEFKLFGDYIHSTFEDNVFSIAFCSAKGTTGTVFHDTPETIKADTSTLEHALTFNNFNYAFIPFNQIIKKHPEIENAVFNTQILGYDNKPGEWLKLFDGVIFIKTNKHATKNM